MQAWDGVVPQLLSWKARGRSRLEREHVIKAGHVELRCLSSIQVHMSGGQCHEERSVYVTVQRVGRERERRCDQTLLGDLGTPP